MNLKKRILVAPLHWGLGHAARCIPIIKALILYDFEPVIASDGAALAFLKKEFPELICVELPSYGICYPKKGKYLKFKLITATPKLVRIIKAEKKAVNLIVKTFNISGIISDNRFGVYNNNVPSVFISHQLNVLSGTTTWLSTKMHQKIIKKYDACWVPDTNLKYNLSGKLGHVNSSALPIKHIGPLSRFKKRNTPIVNDVLVLLSGPEPQRTLLEDKLLKELKNSKDQIILVRGVVEDKQAIDYQGNMTVYNFMTSSLLEKTINESELIISRAGYTTIMDLTKLNKKAFFIPTPGQYEQEYLAKRFTNLNLVPSCSQDSFTFDKLKNMDSYYGLKSVDFEVNFKALFSLFEGE